MKERRLSAGGVRGKTKRPAAVGNQLTGARAVCSGVDALPLFSRSGGGNVASPAVAFLCCRHTAVSVARRHPPQRGGRGSPVETSQGIALRSADRVAGCRWQPLRHRRKSNDRADRRDPGAENGRRDTRGLRTCSDVGGGPAALPERLCKKGRPWGDRYNSPFPLRRRSPRLCALRTAHFF